MDTFLSILAIFAPVIALIAKSVLETMSDRKKAKDDLSKEITDAVASGDESRINGIIQRLRK